MKNFTFVVLITMISMGLMAQKSSTLPATYPGVDAAQLSLAESTVLSINQTNSNKEVASTIDQDQPLDQTYMAAFGQGNLAQSFIPSVNDICGAGVAIFHPSGSTVTADITITIWDNLPNAGGTALASGTTTATIDGTPVFVDVSWSSISITSGTTYYLVFTSTDNSLGLRGHTGNPYPFGHVYANSGYQPFLDFDYTFHTYTCGAASVPIGNWAIIISLLLIGSFLYIRYRRRIA